MRDIDTQIYQVGAWHNREEIRRQAIARWENHGVSPERVDMAVGWAFRWNEAFEQLRSDEELMNLFGEELLLFESRRDSAVGYVTLVRSHDPNYLQGKPHIQIQGMADSIFLNLRNGDRQQMEIYLRIGEDKFAELAENKHENRGRLIGRLCAALNVAIES